MPNAEVFDDVPVHVGIDAGDGLAEQDVDVRIGRPCRSRRHRRPAASIVARGKSSAHGPHVV
jgi:hypothetical protein